MNFIQKHGALIARLLISLIFIAAGAGKIMDFAGTAVYMASAGLPMVDILLILTIIIELLGGLFLLFGFQLRMTTIILFLFMIPVTLVFHFDLASQQQTTQLLKNFAIMGGLLSVLVYDINTSSE